MASPAGSDPSAGTSGAGDGANGGAFSLGELRAAMDSRVTNARAAVQRRLGSMGVGTSADDARASRMPSVPSITELARRAPKLDLPLIGADDSALLNRVRTGVTRAASGMRRSRTHDSPLSDGDDDQIPKELPTVWNMAGKPNPVLPLVNPLPEWDVFKSLKTSGLPAARRPEGDREDAASTSSSDGDGRRFPAMWSPPRLAPSVSSESLDNLRRTVEERMAAAAANMPADMRSPGDWLNEMHDAGGKAVKEWLATARDREGKLSQLRESGGGSAGTGLFRFTPPPVRGGAKRRASGTFDPAGAGPTSPDENAEAEATFKPAGDDEADRAGAGPSHERPRVDREGREAESHEAAAGDAPTTPKEGRAEGMARAWGVRGGRRPGNLPPTGARRRASPLHPSRRPSRPSPLTNPNHRLPHRRPPHRGRTPPPRRPLRANPVRWRRRFPPRRNDGTPARTP